MLLDDFYVLTAQKLGLVSVGETLTDDDNDILETRYTLVHDLLQNVGLTTWGVAEDVPDFVVLPLSSILAAACVDEFSIPEPRRSVLRAEGLLHQAPVSQAERTLRIQMAHQYIPTPNRAEYF